MSVPEAILDRMEKAESSEDAQNIGVEISQDLLQSLRSMVQGVYLMPPFGRYETAIKVIEVL